MEQKPDHRVYLPEVISHRVATARRRAVAFANPPTWLLGCLVLPISLRTWSRLAAIGSPFITGGSADAADILDFIWVHSPHFRDTSRPLWRWWKRWALARALIEFRQPWRKMLGLSFDRDRHLVAVAITIAEIKGLIEDAWADAPQRSAKPAKQIAALEAFMIHEFASAYGWTIDQVRDLPLAQAVQLHKCVRVARGADNEDAGEDQILFEYLKKKNAPRLAQDAAAAAKLKTQN